MDPVYRLRGIRKTYGRAWSLAIEALDILRGQTLAVVGPTGSGKSTLLRLLHLLESPDEGTIEFDGQAIVFPAPVDTIRRITMVFQRPVLLRGTVLDNVRLGRELRGQTNTETPRQVLEALGMTHLAHTRSFPLSGGETQRVAVARALALDTSVLLLDEPTAHLDPAHVLRIERIIRSLQEKGTTTIIVTHHLLQARRLADRTALLLEGQLVEEAETEQFFDHPVEPRTAAFLRGDLVW
ncbi:MAG TPA: ATP-binding cassette domain-containing protein [Anaerolineales bacterium]|nr:ATP-binding cassette domain-containing protein [Anaerolineales bacterium]